MQGAQQKMRWKDTRIRVSKTAVSAQVTCDAATTNSSSSSSPSPGNNNLSHHESMFLIKLQKRKGKRYACIAQRNCELDWIGPNHQSEKYEFFSESRWQWRAGK
jgi:hypothetical protein